MPSSSPSSPPQLQAQPPPAAAPSLAQLILAPAPAPVPFPSPSIFLSGTIDSPSGTTPPWRTQLATALAHQRVTLLDPTRPDWDSSWREDVDFAPFREQVLWELGMMERADVVVVFFRPGRGSEISLLEFGLVVGGFGGVGGMGGMGRGKKEVVVGCPVGFWKRGNVQLVCERLGVEVLGSLEEVIERVRVIVGRLGGDGRGDGGAEGV